MAESAVQKALTIVSLFPSILNTNGDAANARVLAQRARWAGINNVQLIEVETADHMPRDADIIVVGACGDPEVSRAFAMLKTVESALREAACASVPVLALATGWGMLSQSFPVHGQSAAPGLGLFSGSASRSSTRFSDDVIVDSVYGQLVGYENHSDTYLVGPGEEPLGTVVYGSGNGGGTEGAVNGSLIGTHLHGPVLARNPTLADHLLALALARTGRELPELSPQAQVADQYSAHARAAVKASLEN